MRRGDVVRCMRSFPSLEEVSQRFQGRMNKLHRRTAVRDDVYGCDGGRELGQRDRMSGCPWYS